MDLGIIIIAILFISLYLINNSYIKFAINIHKKTKNNYSMFSSEIIKQNKFKSYYEGIFINSRNPILLRLYKKIYDDYKSIFIKPLDSYVSFSRLNLTDSDRLNCDWCSMANGLIRLIADSVNYYKNTNVVCNLKLSNIKFLVNLLKVGLIHRAKKITKEDVNVFIKNNFDGQTSELIEIISTLYLYLEQIEMRWCPFKSMEEYYRNTDYRYLPINKETIYYAGKILSKQDTIECYLCNKILNSNMDIKYMSKENDYSPMKYSFNSVITE